MNAREQALRLDHVDVAISLYQLALVQSRPEDVLPLAERALGIRERAAVAPVLIADARVLLARALWDAPSGRGRDRDRAIALVVAARDAYRAAGNEQRLAEVEGWLRAHRR